MSDRSRAVAESLRASSRGRLAALGLLVAGALLVALVFLGGSVGHLGETDPSSGGAVVDAVSGNETVTITYTDGAGEARSFVVSVAPALSSEADGWAIVDREELPAALREVDDAGSGVVGFGEWALVGEMSAATVDIDGTTLRVVVPAGRDVDPARKAGFVQEFAGPYALSPDSDRPVVIVAAPPALPSRGLMYGDDRGYVTRTTFWDGDVGSVWIHEYVHARQDFRLAPEMQWFEEASAEYLSYRFMQEQYGEVTERDVRDRLTARPEHEGVVLANRSTWEPDSADYHVGSRLLASIDADIRRDSDDEHTLVDVFREMNRQDGPITVSDFVGLVEQRTGEDESWIAATVRGERSIADQSP